MLLAVSCARSQRKSASPVSGASGEASSAEPPRKVLLDHPATVPRSAAWAAGIERAIALDRELLEGLEARGSDSLSFQHPAEALGGGCVELQGVPDDPLEIQIGCSLLEAVEHLGEVPAVVRPGQAVEEGALRIGDRHPGVPDPDPLRTEETLRLDPDESVGVSSGGVALPDLPTTRRSPRPGNGGPGRCKDEDLPRHLVRQAVVVERGPVRDGRRVHQRHGDLELVRWRDPRHRVREGVKPLLQPDQPAGAGQVVEGLAQVALSEPRAVGQLPGSADREDALPFGRQKSDELDARAGLDGLPPAWGSSS